MSLTYKQAAAIVGRQGRWHAPNGLVFDVLVRDVRECFGRQDYEIVPLHGSGARWVEAGSVTIDQEDQA